MATCFYNPRLSVDDVAKIEEVRIGATSLQPPKYEWRPTAENNSVSAAGWNGGDEVGQIARSEERHRDRWTWSVIAKWASEFRDKVITSGRAARPQEAAMLVEAAYDNLMLLNDTANRQFGRKKGTPSSSR